MAKHSHFDHIAKAYNSSLPSHVVAHYLERRVALLRETVPPPGPVLDVGCGTGLLAWRLTEVGYRVVGLEPSTGMLKEAGTFPDALEERAGAAFLQGDGTRLPFRDGSFPAVVSVATLHHVVDPAAVRSVIQEMVRVTAPGGAAVIWDHNPLNPYWPLLMARVPQDEEETRLVSLGEIKAALNGARVRARRMGWVPDFIPPWGLPVVARIERILEAIPGVRALSAHNVIVVRKPA